MGALAAAFLAGITYVSSSGVAAKLLEHAGPHARDAGRFVITIAVIEDLVMALYLPFLAALLLGDDAIGSILAGVIAVTVVIVVLAIALRIEVGLSRVSSVGRTRRCCCRSSGSRS